VVAPPVSRTAAPVSRPDKAARPGPLVSATVAILVAATSALSAAFLLSDDGSPSPHALISGAGPALAAQAAGQTFQSLSIAFSDVVNVWPWHGALIATSVVVYVLLHGALAEFAVPVVTRQKPSRSWVQNPFRGCSIHLVGATVAAALVEVIDDRGTRLTTPEPAIGPPNDRLLTLELGDLGEGVYTVRWWSLSQVDSHRWQGTIDNPGYPGRVWRDGTIEGVASDVVFNGATTRSFHLDARYMLWNMDLLDGADHLIKEMGLEPQL